MQYIPVFSGIHWNQILLSEEPIMNPSKPKALLISLLFSYLLSGILLLLISLALYKWNLKEEQIGLFVYLVYAISCFAGGIFAGKRIRTRRFFWGFLNGMLYFIILFLISIPINGTLPHNTQQILLSLSCCLAGGMIGGMIS